MGLEQPKYPGNVLEILWLVIADSESTKDASDFAVPLDSKYPVPELEVFHLEKRHRLKIPLLHLFGERWRKIPTGILEQGHQVISHRPDQGVLKIQQSDSLKGFVCREPHQVVNMKVPQYQ